MEKTANIFAAPHHDVSYGSAVTETGSVQILSFEYSSVVVAVWEAADIASAEYFLNRFALAIDTWNDSFEPGWKFEANITHRVGEALDADNAVHHVSFTFLGWVSETNVPDGGESLVETQHICTDIMDAVS